MTLPSQNFTLPERGWRIGKSHAFIAALICWTGLALVTWGVATGRTEQLDQMGLLFWRTGDELGPTGPKKLLEAVRDMTALGGVLLRNLIAMGAIAALLFMKLRRESVLLGATIILGWIANSLLKAIVGRPRPEIVPHLTEAGGASFPSGHSFNAAVVYVAIALAFATLSARRSVRTTIIACALVLSLLIAWTRVWLGVHYPSDIVAGWLGGTGWAFMAAALLQRPASHVADRTV